MGVFSQRTTGGGVSGSGNTANRMVEGIGGILKTKHLQPGESIVGSENGDKGGRG